MWWGQGDARYFLWNCLTIEAVASSRKTEDERGRTGPVSGVNRLMSCQPVLAVFDVLFLVWLEKLVLVAFGFQTLDEFFYFLGFFFGGDQQHVANVDDHHIGHAEKGYRFARDVD